MKLNQECVRDLLLAIEENVAIDNSLITRTVNLDGISGFLPSYNKSEIAYTSQKLKEAGLIDVSMLEADGGIVYPTAYYGLTYSGHVYLEKIRDKDIWTQAKKVIKEKSVPGTIEIIGAIAGKVIEKKLNL